MLLSLVFLNESDSMKLRKLCFYLIIIDVSYTSTGPLLFFSSSGLIHLVIYNLKITFKFFTEVLFLSIILCLANTGIVNVLVSTLYSKPDEVTGYECGLYSTKGGRLKDRISFYTVGLTMMIFDVEGLTMNFTLPCRPTLVKGSVDKNEMK